MLPKNTSGKVQIDKNVQSKVWVIKDRIKSIFSLQRLI